MEYVRIYKNISLAFCFFVFIWIITMSFNEDITQ